MSGDEVVDAILLPGKVVGLPRSPQCQTHHRTGMRVRRNTLYRPLPVLHCRICDEMLSETAARERQGLGDRESEVGRVAALRRGL